MALVEDQRLFAELFSAAVAGHGDVELVFVSGTVEEAVPRILRARPDVVLTDFLLPDGTGIDVTARVHEVHPDLPVLMLTGAHASRRMRRAIEAGCVGLLSKDESLATIVDAVTAAARGELVISADQAEHLEHREIQPGAVSERERQVIDLLARGRSVDDIASELFLSHHTVRNHIRHTLDKLGAHSQLEAVLVAIREGLIVLGE